MEPPLTLHIGDQEGDQNADDDHEAIGAGNTPETSAMSALTRSLLLAVFCLALFVDAFMTSAMIISLEKIASSFQVATSVAPWLITAYNLTFGSFLLLAGRISDLYHPKPVFIVGFLLIGILGIGGGFSKNIITLIIIRALQGIGAAMTIPSATSMLTTAYTSQKSQGIALTIFAAAGTLGLSLGFVLGGILLQFSTWRWILWIVPVITIPLSATAFFLISQEHRCVGNHVHKKLDVLGVLALTSSLILLIFALSQAPIDGWKTARVLAPLVISVLMLVAFFFRQTQLSESHAVIPSRMWFIPNFLVLILVSFCTQINLTGPILVLSQFWMAAYDWTPLDIGLHVLPMGVTAMVVCVLLPRQILQLPPRFSLVGASGLTGLSSILLVYSSSRQRYWSFTFPSMILVTIGSTAAYMISNVGIVTSVSLAQVGVAAGIFNAAQQVGGAINVAIVTTILDQLKFKHPYPSYHAPSSTMWFFVASGLTQAVAVLCVYRPQKQFKHPDDRENIEVERQ